MAVNVEQAQVAAQESRNAGKDLQKLKEDNMQILRLNQQLAHVVKEKDAYIDQLSRKMKVLIDSNEKVVQENEKFRLLFSQQTGNQQQIYLELQSLVQIKDQNQQLRQMLTEYQEEANVWKLRAQELEQVVMAQKGMVPKFHTPTKGSQTQQELLQQQQMWELQVQNQELAQSMQEYQRQLQICVRNEQKLNGKIDQQNKILAESEGKLLSYAKENERLRSLLQEKMDALEERGQSSQQQSRQSDQENQRLKNLIAAHNKEIEIWKQKYDEIEKKLQTIVNNELGDTMNQERINELEEKISILIEENDKLNILINENMDQTANIIQMEK